MNMRATRTAQGLWVRSLGVSCVKKWQWLILGGLCILTVCGAPAYGCQYNVREVGFIDLGVDPYRLLVYVPDTVPPREIDNLKNTLNAMSVEVNVRCEPISVGADANDPALQFLPSHSTESLPAAVVVSPDGQSRPLALPGGERSLVEAVSLSLEPVLESPTRRQILEKAADSYGVVLLIEGPQAERNVAAREIVSAATSYINSQLAYLPKPIAKGPEVVVLEYPSLAREDVLLWALGLKPQDINEPCAAVFYGRGRWLGPIFKGETLTDEYLARLLAVVGADCECGLDHHWLQGTMLPLRWDQRLQQKVTASLGFDPESPMVKMEMVSIVRRGMGTVGSTPPEVPFGYREIEIGGEAENSPAPSAADSNDVTVTLDEEPIVPAVAPTPIDGLQDDPTPKVGIILAASLGGMVVLVAAISAVVLLRAKKG